LDVLAASLAFTFVYSFYSFNRYSGTSFSHPVFPYVTATISVVLMLLIITLVFSFYRAKGNKDALIGMLGYLLILSNVAYGFLNYDSVVWSITHNGTDWGAAIANVLSLSGYIVILAAIIRKRVAHG
jgi:hypothetical protein